MKVFYQAVTRWKIITMHMLPAFGLAKISHSGKRVLPPVYEKRVGRPPKARKKQAHEVPGKNGPRLTRHGVTIHCKHCSEAGHNSVGCSLKRRGFTAEDAKALVARMQATLEREAQEQAMRAAADQVPSEQVTENEIPDPLNISSII